MEQEPWPVRSSCPAQVHNTRTAAQGIYKIKKQTMRQEPCVCDHAVQLLIRHREKSHQNYAESVARKTRTPSQPDGKKVKPQRHTQAAPKAPTVTWPDLTEGACMSAGGTATMDAYTNMPNVKSTISAARDLCVTCPLRRECDEWISKAERPAGSWHGIFAGRTPRERALASRGATA